jgi:hypothetical protein
MLVTISEHLVTKGSGLSVSARRAIKHVIGGTRRRTRAAALTAAATLAVVVSLGFASVAMATEPESTAVSAGEHGKDKDKVKDDGKSSDDKGKEEQGTGGQHDGTDDKGKPDDEAKKDGQPGDNGTVKIHELGTAADDRRNQPKVCAFYLDAFGFDAGQSVVWRISQHPPTGTAAAKAGAIVLNAEGAGQTSAMTLPPGHYKLVWKFTGEHGKAKHKVFWVRCKSDDKPDGDDKPDKCDDRSGKNADDKAGKKDDEKSSKPDDKSGDKDDEKSDKDDEKSDKGGDKSGKPDDKCDGKDDDKGDKPDDDKPDDDKGSEVGSSRPTPTAQAAVTPGSEVSAESLAKTGAQTPLLLGMALALLAAGVAVFLATGGRSRFGRRH